MRGLTDGLPNNITKEPKGYKHLIGWSPDGKWIVFSKYDYNPTGMITYPSDEEIWVSSPDGNEKYYLGNCYDSSVYWAPDSSYVVLADYSKRESPPDNYLLYYVNDFEKRIILDEFKNIYGYSPKGYFHSFVYNEDPIVNIMDLEGNIINSYQYSDRLNPVLEPCEIDSVYYISSTGIWSWFPDSNRFLEMIYCGTPIYPSDNVAILETIIADEITSRAFAYPSNRGLPIISPNGKWILFVEWGSDRESCGILDSEFNQVSDFMCNNPKWSPDGNVLFDLMPIREQNEPSIVFIDPLTGDTKQANSLQWLADLPDTANQGLWEIQPME